MLHQSIIILITQFFIFIFLLKVITILNYNEE